MVYALMLTLVAGSTDWECDFFQKQWREQQLDAPCKVLTAKDPAARAAQAKKAWGLDDAAATCAAAVPTKGAEQAAAAWADCIEKSPGQYPLWLALTASGAPAPARRLPALEKALASLDDPLPVAEHLLRTTFAPQALATRVILTKQPQRLAELLARPSLAGETLGVVLPLLDQPRKTPFTAAEWRVLGEVGVRDALLKGSPTLAAQLWLELPAKTRGQLTAHPLASGWGRGKAPVKEEDDLRLDLALALLAAGNPEAARPVFKAAPVGEAKKGKHVCARALLELHLDGKRTLSPWEAGVAARVACRLAPEELPLLTKLLGPEVELAVPLVQQFVRSQHASWRRKPEDAVDERIEALRAKSEAQLLALFPQARAERASGGGADGGTAALPTPPWPYTERKTPWKGKAAKALATQQLGLRGFWPVRAEQHGRTRVVLAQSQRVDPVGEVSGGGYWLLIAEGDGPWQQTYLGFSEHRPFSAHQQSAVPLLDHGVVRVDVDEAPLDEQSITFPPIGLRADTVRAHVVLEAKLSALRQDSDGDGLTDLLEARLLLNPNDKDTDHDGMPDDADATPRLNDSLAPTPRAEVLNAFFEDMNPREQPAPIVMGTHPSGAKPELELGRVRRADLEDVRFLVGSPAELGGLKPLSRIISLTEEELEAARRTFGTFYPLDVQVTVSSDGDHAFIQWSEKWRGGSSRADKQADGRWVLTTLRQWIT